jgi:hypothetical protein
MTADTPGATTPVPALTYPGAVSKLKWLRDCGSGLVVGGSSIALTMMLTDDPLHRQIYWAFLVLFVIFFGASWILANKIRSELPDDKIRGAIKGIAEIGTVANALLSFGVAILEFLGVKFDVSWPLEPYKPLWWTAVGAALSVALGGEYLRRSAEATIDGLCG